MKARAYSGIFSAAVGKGVTLLCFVGLLAVGFTQEPRDELKSGFETPPASAKPRVWWHSMNGNVTKEGSTADLEWMKRAGIGGMSGPHIKRTDGFSGASVELKPFAVAVLTLGP